MHFFLDWHNFIWADITSDSVSPNVWHFKGFFFKNSDINLMNLLSIDIYFFLFLVAVWITNDYAGPVSLFGLEDRKKER
jgi:hypothetical protein